MPKEKATTRKSAKSAKADGGKKKKGALKLHVADLTDPVADLSPDPNMPKRGLSAYMFFANEQRDKVREENPNIKFGMSLRLYSTCRVVLTSSRRGWKAAW